MTYYPKCGNENQDDEKICSKCDTPTGSTTLKQEDKHELTTMHVIIIIIGFIGVIYALLVLFGEL